MTAVAPVSRSGPVLARLLLVGLQFVVAPSATSSQTETCPNPRGGASVEITLPSGGATVSGVILVEGTVRAAEPVFQLELFVGDARRDFVAFDPPVSEASFSLRWDATSRAPGPATIRAVACGGIAAEGSLIRGQATVDVMVEASAAGARTGGTLSQQPVRSEGVEWAPTWVGLTFGIAGLGGLVYALRQSPLDRQPTADQD